MSVKHFLLYGFFTVLCLNQKLEAQENAIGRIARQMHYYSLKNPSSALFVHFDKNVYTNSEMVWFTGYLLKSRTPGLHHTLSVSLVSNSDRSVILSRQFEMKKGLAMGDLLLPDTIVPGNYSFVAYTNVLANGEPEDIFIQPLTIKTISQAPFNASLKLVDSVGLDGSLKVLLQGSTRENFNLADARISYALDNGQGALGQSVQTDSKGEYLFKVPLREVDELHSVLRLKIRKGEESRDLQLSLPIQKVSGVLKFYPEGGQLVENLQGYVGWETRTLGGQPFAGTGILYKNGEAVDTLYTNSMGIGKFTLTPERGAVYSLQLRNTTISGGPYPLPPALAEGYNLTLREALSNDSVKVFIRGTRPSRVSLLIHDYRGVYLSTTLDMQVASRVINIPLDGVSKGVMTMTLLDSLGRPVAERLFFAHYAATEKLIMGSDKEVYGKREKVRLKLQLAGQGGKAVQGLVSVACVQSNRNEWKNTTDIENYTYLEHELEGLPKDPRGEGFRNREYMEDILLVKGWRKYTWPELEKLQPADTTINRSSAVYTGAVTNWEQVLKKPATVNVLKGKMLSTVVTDAGGHFELSPALLLSNPDKQVELDIPDKNSKYKISVKVPYEELAPSLAAKLTFKEEGTYFNNTTSALLNRNERAIALSEVRIAGTRDESIYGLRSRYANACGDYVCPSGVLNCSVPDHLNNPKSTKPIEGHKYMFRDRSPVRPASLGSIIEITYQGCEQEAKNQRKLSIDGIYRNREFYAPDYSKENLPGNEYYSTLYWNHGILLKPDGTAEISFYTSDITGNFRIVAQGVSDQSIIYAENSFSVKGK